VRKRNRNSDADRLKKHPSFKNSSSERIIEFAIDGLNEVPRNGVSHSPYFREYAKNPAIAFTFTEGIGSTVLPEYQLHLRELARAEIYAGLCDILWKKVLSDRLRGPPQRSCSLNDRVIFYCEHAKGFVGPATIVGVPSDGVSTSFVNTLSR